MCATTRISPVSKPATRHLVAAFLSGACVLTAACGGGDGPTAPPTPTGTLQLVITTDGRNIDPDGYTLTVGGGPAQSVSIDDTVLVAGLAPGLQTVTLGGVSTNCHPYPAPSVDVVVNAEDTRQYLLGVECLAPPADLTLTFSRLKNSEPYIRNLAVIRASTGALEPLTFNPTGFDWAPDWSPDGSRLAWERSGVIHIVNADGTGLRSFTDRGQGSNPAWSPDGKLIAYDNGTNILVFDPDGTGETVLATGIQPAWSPDGTKIAFEHTDATTESDIIVMNADGSGAVNITREPLKVDREPAWSPDGTRIVFRRLIRTESTGYDLWVMDADGGNATKLLELPGAQLDPVWVSANRILFDHDRAIWAIDLDAGGALTNLTGEPGFIHNQPAVRK